MAANNSRQIITKRKRNPVNAEDVEYIESNLINFRRIMARIKLINLFWFY